MKQELNLPELTIKYVPVNIQNRMALVANGTVDIECGSTVNTLGRQKQVDFTLVTFIAADRLMAKQGSGIKEIEDLAGKVAIVPQASTSEKVLNELVAEKKLDIKVNLIRDHADALLSVETGPRRRLRDRRHHPLRPRHQGAPTRLDGGERARAELRALRLHGAEEQSDHAHRRQPHARAPVPLRGARSRSTPSGSTRSASR